MAWNSDFLMRRFLGEHPNPAQDDDSLQQEEQGLPNPNLSDLPPPEAGHEAGASGGANPFWSPRIPGEYQLQQMRPSHLPPPSETQGRSSDGLGGSEAVLMTAREMDSKTSCIDWTGRFGRT